MPIDPRFDEGDGGGGGSGVGGSVGVGTPLLLPPSSQSEKIELVSAGQGQPWPLAYGRHIVGGQVIFSQEQSDKSLKIAYALGRGEWDGPEVIWVNGDAITLPPTASCHFHPGLGGELGVESAPATPNQKICSLYPTAWTPQLTFSQIAYLMLHLAANPRSPGPIPDVRGIYRTRLVRNFDNTGAQTAYAYSANPARALVDAYLAYVVQPHALPNTALTTADKARFDWPAFVDARDYHDADPGDGEARFEAHIALVEFSDLQRWIELINLSGRLFVHERAGKLVIRPDKPRSSVMTLGRNLLAGPAELLERDRYDAPREFRLKARILDSGNGTATDDFQSVRRIFSKEDEGDLSGVLAAGLAGQPTQFDLQNTTMGRLQRTGEYLRGRLLDAPQQFRYPLLAEDEAAAANPLELEPGDRVAGPSEVEAFATSDHEILELSTEPDFSRNVAAQEYDEAIFSDALGPEQVISAPDPGPGLPIGAGIGNHSFRSRKNVLRASDVGASATIFIEDPDTNDDFDVVVSGYDDLVVQDGELTGFGFNETWHVYYEDFGNPPTGGAKTFFAVEDKEDAIGLGKVYLGAITTPPDGGADTFGDNTSGVGAQTGGVQVFRPGTITESQFGGAPAHTNPNNARDGDTSTKATVTITGNSGSQFSLIDYTNFPASNRVFKKLTLYIRYAVPVNTLNGSGPAARFEIRYVTNGGSLASGTLAKSLTVAQTQAVEILDGGIDLAVGQNMALLGVRIGKFGHATDSAGQIDAEDYEVWVEGVE